MPKGTPSATAKNRTRRPARRPAPPAAPQLAADPAGVAAVMVDDPAFGATYIDAAGNIAPNGPVRFDKTTAATLAERHGGRVVNH